MMSTLLIHRMPNADSKRLLTNDQYALCAYGIQTQGDEDEITLLLIICQIIY